MEQGYSQQGFVLSLSLHVVVVVTVTALAWFKPFQRSEPKVFEVIQIPRGSPGMNAPNDGNNTPFNLPETRPTRPTPARTPPPPPRPTPPQTRPTPPVPAPQNVVTPPRAVTPPPQPAPTPRVTAPAVPVPVRAPAVTPAPTPPERISYRDFVDQHGKPQPRAPRTNPPAPARPVSAPRIDTRFPVNLSDAVRTPGSLTGMTDAQQSALGLYIGTLKDALQRYWDKPAGVPAATMVVVEFDLSPSGRVTNVRVVEKSGIPAFDESVLTAFARLTTVGPTPEGRELLLRLTFRMKDE